MDDLLARTAMVVPVAVLLPLGLSTLPRASRRALLAAAIVLAALATNMERWETWAVVVCAAAAAAAPVPNANRPWALLGAVGAAFATSVMLVDSDGTVGGLEAVADDWRVTVVLAGGLACVFVGGAVIGTIMHPFAERVSGRSDVAGMENAGRVIGWIERALLYGLVLVGAPGAAALVIAGKSIARFPLFREERFAEYYLIGSLMSLAIALGAGLGVRAIIGLEPVAPL